ncbi:MAG: RNA polymerase sigma factor SigX [Tumebacillaceae bacterium]
MEVYAQMPDHSQSPPVSWDTGAERSFPDLFKAHYPQVVRQIMRITRDQAVAEDLAQEVFLRLHDQDITRIDNIGAWLTQAGTYAAYNHLRGEKRRIARDEQQSDASTTVEPSTEERWLQQEEIASVREALIDLNERDRTLLLLKYSGYDYQELANVTQVEQSSIGTLLARAKRRFRDLYQRKRGDER